MATAAAAAEPAGPPAAPFDPAIFERDISLVCVSVPAPATSKACKTLAGRLFTSAQRHRPVIYDTGGDATRRVVLLAEDVPDEAALGEAVLAQLRELGARFGRHTVHIGYENVSAEEALRVLLPAGTPKIPAGFEMVGHIAHLNLREDLWPYKYAIGRVILDKNPVIRTVVNKTGTINTKFRTFPMEVIAGEDRTTVEVREIGARFRFDFRHVYWNTRLQHEHEKMATKVIPAGSVVADMFAGVGPFAVPLAMPPQRCTVYANDLNPHSFAALQGNVALNKVGRLVHCYNQDGREFIRRISREGVPYSHVLMNLPADAIEFCDAFVGAFRAHPDFAAKGTAIPMPTLHVYCFSKAETLAEADPGIRDRVMAALHVDAEPAGADAGTADWKAEFRRALQIRDVRDVAPNKLMACVTFQLPPQVAFSEQVLTYPTVDDAVSGGDDEDGAAASAADAAAALNGTRKRARMADERA